ncbi:MAG: transcription antitermination factor NusB [Oscillospiraceae bacterium]|nr:transcription antitermination factor NusB [Oscillospiraceae bacterium]
MLRTVAREIAVRLNFALSENPSDPEQLLERVFEEEYYATLYAEDELFEESPDDLQRIYISSLVKGVYEHGAELDGYIDKYAVGWSYGRISRTAAAVMKTAMFEVLYMPEIPDRVAINEAVEIAKKYETPQTVSFINGVLGSFQRGEMF